MLSTYNSLLHCTEKAQKQRYIQRYIYTNFPVNAIVRLPHPWSGDSQGQETFLARSADKQTRNHDTECLNYIFENDKQISDS